MVFSSLMFLTCALPVALAVYYLLPRSLRNHWLLVFSLVFYAWGEPVYLLLMLFSIAFNYLCGLGMERFPAPRVRKGLMALALVVNLGMLFAFKYLGFFAGLAGKAFGFEATVSALALPIGISFYTFQALSYTIDVYRGTVPAQRSLPKLALYITFFPQLIAGPILRYDGVAPQIEQRRETLAGFAKGMRRFVVGLGKKVLIANAVAALADEAFAASGLSLGSAWLGAIAYALQILFDFSGYSDMAIGLGSMFGFEYPENFNEPYIALSVRDFWRRWHIALSTWFRDYLFIPLGGTRRGNARHIVNLLIVFLVTGLWHGAGMTFLAWGVYYGLLSALDVALDYRPAKSAAVRALQHLITLLLVLIGWVMFRADTMADAVRYLHGMVSGGTLLLHSMTPRALCAVALGCLCATSLPRRALSAMPEATRERLSVVATPALLLLCLLTLASGAYNPFIYFRF